MPCHLTFFVQGLYIGQGHRHERHSPHLEAGSHSSGFGFFYLIGNTIAYAY